MAKYWVQAGSTKKLGNKVSGNVRFQSTDGLTTSAFQYIEIESLILSEIQDVLADIAKKWEVSLSVPATPTPIIPTGQWIDAG